MCDLTKIVQEVVALSREVGHFIAIENAHFDRSKIQQKSSFRDLVSYVDKESEKKLVKGLKKILPGAGILAEEGTSLKSQNEYLWIIDPLDGTTNFYHGLPPYAISIGLTKGENSVLGVVYEVTKKECFYATKGGDAYCDGKKINISTTASIQESLLSTGFPYAEFDGQEKHLSIMKFFMKNTHGVRRMGSAAVDLAYVACGRLDGFFECNLNAWDVAAGSLIVEQAGGKVSDFSGKRNFLFGKEICAAGKIHPDMMKIVTPYWLNNEKAE